MQRGKVTQCFTLAILAYLFLDSGQLSGLKTHAHKKRVVDFFFILRVLFKVTFQNSHVHPLHGTYVLQNDESTFKNRNSYHRKPFSSFKSYCCYINQTFIFALIIAQLQATLATFYAPKPPISEVTIVEYRDPISRLARRFFHHLLRYARFDKAFLLAVDIGARDLFMVNFKSFGLRSGSIWMCYLF